MLQKPGDLPYPCQGQNKLKRLPRATHCTDRAQTSGNVTATNGRIVPTPLTLRVKVKVRARRDVSEEKKMIIIRMTNYYGKYFERLFLSLTGISDAKNSKNIHSGTRNQCYFWVQKQSRPEISGFGDF